MVLCLVHDDDDDATAAAVATSGGIDAHVGALTVAADASQQLFTRSISLSVRQVQLRLRKNSTSTLHATGCYDNTVFCK